VCGFRLRAYLTAPTVAKSTLSTNTVTSCLAIEVARAFSCASESTACSRTYLRFNLSRETIDIGAIVKIIQAPSVNLTIEKIITTTSETAPAKPFKNIFAFQFLVRFSRACLAIPKPERVKPVKTPSA